MQDLMVELERAVRFRVFLSAESINVHGFPPSFEAYVQTCVFCWFSVIVVGIRWRDHEKS